MTDAPVDPWSMSAESVTAKLNELTQAYNGELPQDPQSKLNRKYQDPEFQKKLQAGDGKSHAEFQELAKAASEMSPIDMAMAGVRPDVPSSELRQMEEMAGYLRSLGLRDDVVKEAIDTNSMITQEVHDAAVNWKKEHMTDAEYVKRYLNGEISAVKEVTLCNILLIQPIKGKAA